jgi:cellulose synthase/poly-beta-1,6-N-acetylglucosamine synthase-like glycosyltransferase
VFEITPWQALGAVQYFFALYVGAVNLIYFALMILGFFVLRNTRTRLTDAEHLTLLRSPLTPSVSIVAPAYNEEAAICQSVRAMLSLHHPNHEVIVVNDGSKDDTLKLLIEEFRLYRSARQPRAQTPCQRVRAIYESRDPIPLVVVDKENGGGKADALNAGLNISDKDLVAIVDSDSILEPDALLSVLKPFMTDADCIACGGIIRVVNGCEVRDGRVVKVDLPRNLLARFQVLEYLRAFLGGRVAFSYLNSLLLISGAFGLFRREMIVACGGFERRTIGEDMELIVRLHKMMRRDRRRYRVDFVPDPVCWTQVPEDLASLGTQRNRWQRGTGESITRHWQMLLNPRYGIVGVFALPYFALFEMLGPAIEIMGYVLTIVGVPLGFVSVDRALLFLSISVLFGLVLSTGAILLEEFTLRKYPSMRHVLELFATAVLENLGYRQIMAVWRTRGLIDGLFSTRSGWGTIRRHKFERP